MSGWSGSGKDLLGAVAEAKVGVRCQDQDWESEGWKKHRVLRTISSQCLQATKCAQWCVKPQPCRVTCNLTSRPPPLLIVCMVEARGDPTRSPHTHSAVRMLTQGSPMHHAAVSGSRLPMAMWTSISASCSKQTPSTWHPMPDKCQERGPGVVPLFQIRILNVLLVGSSSDHTARGETRTRCRGSGRQRLTQPTEQQEVMQDTQRAGGQGSPCKHDLQLNAAARCC